MKKMGRGPHAMPKGPHMMDGKMMIKKGKKSRRRPRRESSMPSTKKGLKIKAAMAKEYGKSKGERVFYASANKGTIKGVHKGRKK